MYRFKVINVIILYAFVKLNELLVMRNNMKFKKVKILFIDF